MQCSLASSVAIVSAMCSTSDDIPPRAPMTGPRTLPRGVEPRLEATVLVTAAVFVESLDLCVVNIVDAFLAGVDCCVGFTGLVVGVRIALG